MTNLERLRKLQVRINKAIVLYRRKPSAQNRMKLTRLQQLEARLIKLASREY